MFRSREAEAFLAGLEDSAATQSRFLLEDVLAPNHGCDFGKRHDFASVKTIDDYRRAVPIRDFEGFRADVERIDAKETGVLTTEPVKRFFTTSGSTAKPKYIPVTQSFIRDKSRAFGIFWSLVFRDHPEVEKGRMVTNFSDAGRPTPSPGGLPTSSESAYWSAVTAATQRKKPIIPKDVARIPDHAERYAAIARILLVQEFSAIMALNPSTILLLFRTLDQRFDEIVSSIESDHPDRAKALSAGERWFPSLRLAISWRSPMLKPYLDMLAPYLEGVAVRDYISMASEGILAVPLKDDESGGALGVGICFYELLPEDGDETILPHEAEVGAEYRVILTNRAGLYRYDIGDVVRVKRFEGTTPVVEFLHRAGRTSSLTGEKLTEAQVTAAVTNVLAGAPVESFTLAPLIGDGLPRYVLLAERAPGTDTNLDVAARLDDELGAVNGEYRGKRKSLRLGPLSVWVVAPGSYAKEKAARIAAGTADLQYKHTHLVRDRAYAERFEIVERYDRAD